MSYDDYLDDPDVYTAEQGYSTEHVEWGKRKLAFQSAVFSLKESGVPFSKMRQDRAVFELYQEANRFPGGPAVRERFFPETLGEKNYDLPSPQALRKAYAKEAKRRNVVHDFTTAVDHRAFNEAVVILAAAGWEDFRIATAFGVSAKNVRQAQRKQTPVA